MGLVGAPKTSWDKLSEDFLALQKQKKKVRVFPRFTQEEE